MSPARSLRHLLPLALVAVFELACSDDNKPDTGPADAGPTDAPMRIDATDPVSDAAMDAGIMDAVPMDATPMDATPMDAAAPDASPQAPEDCDPIMPASCVLPWPSNLYLAPDAMRATGYTLTFGATSLPENTSGERIDPAVYRRLDGYGVGEPIIVLFPDLDASGLPDEEEIEQSIQPAANILFFSLGKGGPELVPYFAELDSNETDPSKRVLFVRPAVLLRENTRYFVGMRGLVDSTGAAFPRSEAFDKLANGTTAGDPLLEPRQARFDEIFLAMEAAGATRTELQLAWDFHTASSDALNGRMISMRDQAFAASPDLCSAITVTGTTAYIPAADGSGRPVEANVAFEIEGTIRVPRYLRNTFVGIFQGTTLNLDANSRPVRQGVVDVEFWVRVPRSAVTSSATHNLTQYGHGLLGSGREVRGGYLGEMANTHRLILFAASLMGMSEADMQAVGVTLSNLTAFPFIGDTLHQGMLNWLFLGRAMKQCFATLPIVLEHNIVVDANDMYYTGNSQGGIFGATYMALTQDVERGNLGVSGQNYSTLLHRSVDFTPFFTQLASNYPSTVDQAIGLSTIQLLWNGTDPVSYYRHIAADPFVDTNAHQVLATLAKGDHQVSLLTMEIVARTGIGIPLMENYDDERTPALSPQASYPRTGSGIVNYDFGNPWPSPGNHVTEDTGMDPHGLPRRAAHEQLQVVTFFRTGEIVDVCGGDGCRPD